MAWQAGAAMVRKSGIGIDIRAISRAHELRAETLALQRETHALIGRTRDERRNSVIRGISTPMLMEFAYDLTALGLHDLARLCRATADETGQRARQPAMAKGSSPQLR